MVNASEGNYFYNLLTLTEDKDIEISIICCPRDSYATTSSAVIKMIKELKIATKKY